MIRAHRWLIVVGLLLPAAVARADEKSHRKAAETLLLTMGVDKQLQGTMD